MYELSSSCVGVTVQLYYLKCLKHGWFGVEDIDNIVLNVDVAGNVPEGSRLDQLYTVRTVGDSWMVVFMSYLGDSIYCNI